eukprot:gene5618-8948_t
MSLPANKGDRLAEIDTPALIVIKPILEKNIEQMKKIMSAFPHVLLRPHLKAHKSSYIARAQAAAGVKAWCCQKLFEAEAILDDFPGMKDLLITNEIVGSRKIERLVKLIQKYPKTTVTILIDNPENCKILNTALAKAGVGPLNVLAEIDVGQERCGVLPASLDLVHLATTVRDLPNLVWKGIQCYQGKLQHVRNYQEKRRLVYDIATKAANSRDTLLQHGHTCSVISGGGTGTFVLEAEAGVHNESQPGSYVFMDADYSCNLGKDGTRQSDFGHSLFIHTTIMSKPLCSRLIVDAGMKAVSLDSGPPIVVMLNANGTFSSFEEDCEYVCGGDEHGIIRITSSTSRLCSLEVGATLQLIPGHCDPTVNMYDFFTIVTDDLVEDIVPIQGRGPGV